MAEETDCKPQPSHYDILKVSKSANLEDITKAYKQQARLLHPDKSGEQSTRAFQHLVDARDALLGQMEHNEEQDNDKSGNILNFGLRPSQLLKLQFEQWKSGFTVDKLSLTKFPLEFQKMLTKFSGGFLTEQCTKTSGIAGQLAIDKTSDKLETETSPLVETLGLVQQATNSIKKDYITNPKKIAKIYKQAIDQGYDSEIAMTDSAPIVDFSKSQKAELRALLELFLIDEIETIEKMNCIQLNSRLLRYVPSKPKAYLSTLSDCYQSTNKVCPQCLSQCLTHDCGICTQKYCKCCSPSRKQLYGYGSILDIDICSSCLKHFYQEHAKEWVNQALSFIEGGSLETLKAAFGCIEVALSLFERVSLKSVEKKLLYHNCPELVLPLAIASQQQASGSLEKVKASKFLSTVLKSLATRHTDFYARSWLLTAAKEAALLATGEATHLKGNAVDTSNLQISVNEIDRQLKVDKRKHEEEQKRYITRKTQQIWSLWSSKKFEAIIDMVQYPAEEYLENVELKALENFVQAIETLSFLLTQENCQSLTFFRGILKLFHGEQCMKVIAELEQVVWQDDSKILKNEAINILLALYQKQPTIFGLEGLQTVCNKPKALMSEEVCQQLSKRELQLVSTDKVDTNPSFKRQWTHYDLVDPKLSRSIQSHRKCEAAFAKHFQDKSWGPQDIGYAYVDYIQRCQHPAEIATSTLHAAMWFLKDLKDNDQIHGQPSQIFALKKLIFSLLANLYVIAYFRLHPGMQLYAGRSALAIALETLKKAENVAEPDDTKLISALLHMVTYNSRFVPFWNFPSVPVSEAVMLNIISQKLHVEYLEQLKDTTNKMYKPISEAELQYQLYENDLCYVHKTEDPESLHETAMKELLAEKGWTTSDVSKLMTSPLTVRDRDGWIIQQPKFGHEQEFAKIEGIILNLDNKSPSIELVVVPADNLRGQMGTCSQTDFMHVLSMIDEADGTLCFSLDPPDDQKKFHPFQEFRYTSEKIYNSDLLHTLFETDYLMKSFSVGADVSAKPPFKQRLNEEGLTKNLPTRLQEKLKPVSKRGTKQTSTHRFWIQADNINYSEEQNYNRIEIRLGEMEMIIRSHPLIPGEDGKLKDTSHEDDPDSPEATFAADMTEVYNELGLHFPMFTRLKELAKLQVLGLFLRSILQDLKTKSENISWYIPRYVAFSNLLKTFSRPTSTIPSTSPCKWVPAALLEEEKENYHSLCYGGVLIAPEINKGDVPHFSHRSKCIPITSKVPQVYTHEMSDIGGCNSRTKSKHTCSQPSSLKPKAESTRSQWQPKSQSKYTSKTDPGSQTRVDSSFQHKAKSHPDKLEQTDPITKSKPSPQTGSGINIDTEAMKQTANPQPPKRNKWNFGSKQINRNYSQQALPLYSESSSGREDEESSYKYSAGSVYFGLSSAIALVSVVLHDLRQMFGDKTMKADKSLKEISSISSHNINCKRANCTACALDKIAGISEFKTSDGVTYKTTNVSRNIPYCVYLIACKKSGHRYIGMTTRKACKRLMEHLRDIRKERKNKRVARHFNSEEVGCFGQFEEYMTITPLASVSMETMNPYNQNERKRIMEYIEAQFLHLIGDAYLLNGNTPCTSFDTFDQPPDLNQLFSVTQGKVIVDGQCFLTASGLETE